MAFAPSSMAFIISLCCFVFVIALEETRDDSRDLDQQSVEFNAGANSDGGDESYDSEDDSDFDRYSTIT